MEKTTQDKRLSSAGFVFIVMLIFTTGILLAGFVHRQSLHDYDTVLKSFRDNQHYQSVEAAHKIEATFAQIYQNIRTISKLPSVRTIDRHAKNLSLNDRIAIQEIYNNLASNVAVSEVYILPLDFNPERIDPVTGKNEEPIIMFDQMIVGRTADDYLVKEESEDESADSSVPQVEEIEFHEYRQMAQTLAWLRQEHSAWKEGTGMDLPAVSGSEVITCDNSRYSPKNPRDSDRSGIIYSVPFYDMDGKLKGMVSAIILTPVIQELLPDAHYALSNNARYYRVKARNPSEVLQAADAWIEKEEVNPSLLYSEVLPLSIIDGSGQWKLWSGVPDGVFFQNPHTRNIWEYRNGAYAAIALIVILAIGFLIDLRRRYRQENSALTLARDKAEASSHESAEFLTNVINSTVDALITIDESGRIETFNPAAEKIFGYSRGEAVGQNIKLIMPEPYHSEHDGYLRNYRETGKAKIIGAGVEAHGKRKNGEVFPVEIAISEVKLIGRRVFTGILRDISDRKYAEESLKKYAKELEQAREAAELATRLKSEFLANMSHEIRTPMNGVMGMASLLLGCNLKPVERDYAKTIMSSAEGLLSLLNDILDFSKIEAGRVEFEHIPFDFQLLCEEVCEMMAARAQEKKLELLLYYPYGAPRYVLGDPGRVRQIFLNLIGNAIKFTEQGHVLVRVTIDGGMPDKTVYAVEIEDTGIGIPDDKHEYIFNKFVQADGSTTRKFGGTGLGLAICKDLVRLMGGKIGVRNAKEKGAVFWFDLPLEIDNSGKAALDMPRAGSLQGIKALIVDDNKTARTILREQLSMDGCIITEAENGVEALKLLETGASFDVAILDFMMPVMDGMELGKKIKETAQGRDILLLMLTSAPIRGDSRQMEETGFAGYLNKPLGHWYLRDALLVITEARKSGKKIPLVTRHNLKEAKAGQEAMPGKKTAFSRVHILLAEDNVTNQEVATAILERFGCRVTLANNGQEAVRLIEQDRFDLVLMDCQMPVMDGFEATLAIRQLEKEKEIKRTPIIAFTANALKGDDQKCFQAGMDDYITKPVRKTEIERILVKWLPREKRVVGE